MGQRTNPEPSRAWLRGTRAGLGLLPAQKVRKEEPVYSDLVRGPAKRGLGCTDNRHLNYLAEFILVNVGGLHWHVKVSSLPKSKASVGGFIVVGGRKSLPQSEASQLVGNPKRTNR